MKNPILRILLSAIVFSLISGIFLLIVCLLLGWKTSTQFSDGFFWAGAIVISIGFVNLLGNYYNRTVSGLQYSQSAVHLDATERYQIWAADILHGHRLLAFLGISGLLLCGLSGLAILIGRLF
jgi:hypothetical protein